MPESTAAVPAVPADLMTPAEAARRLGVSRRTLYRMIGEGPPWAVRISGRWRISRPLLERFLHKDMAPATDEAAS